MREQPTRILADATVLIGLARIGHLDLLDALPFPVSVTAGVWREVTGNPGKQGVSELLRMRAEGRLLVVEAGSRDDYPHLGLGEAETLSAASRLGAAVVVDDEQARKLLKGDPNLAASIPASLTTVGLVVLAKRVGCVSTVQSVLDALIARSFRLSTGVYERALRAAGEWPPRREAQP